MNTPKNEIREITVKELKSFRDAGRPFFQAEGRVPSANPKKCKEIGERLASLWEAGQAVPMELIPSVYSWTEKNGEDKQGLGEGFHRTIGISQQLGDDETVEVNFRSFPSLGAARLSATRSNAADLKTPETTFQTVIMILTVLRDDENLTVKEACGFAGISDMKETTFNQYRATINKLVGPLASLKTAAAKGELNRVSAQAILERFTLTPPASAKASPSYIASLVKEVQESCPAFTSENTRLRTEAAEAQAVLEAVEAKAAAETQAAEAKAAAEAAEKAAEAAEAADSEQEKAEAAEAAEKAAEAAEAAEKEAAATKKAADKASKAEAAATKKAAEAAAAEARKQEKAAEAEARKQEKAAEAAEGEAEKAAAAELANKSRKMAELASRVASKKEAKASNVGTLASPFADYATVTDRFEAIQSLLEKHFEECHSINKPQLALLLSRYGATLADCYKPSKAS